MKLRTTLPLMVGLMLLLGPVTHKGMAGDVKQGDKIAIVTPGTVARLCPHPNCGQNQHLTRIPKGTKLTVEGIIDVQSGMMNVQWFEVTFKGKRGWISIFDTDRSQ